MNDDYLWDRSGKPDPEVVRLEEVLAELRHVPRAAPSMLVRPARRMLYRLAAVAALALFVIAGWLLSRPPRGWQVARLEGSPTIGGRTMPEAGRLRPGEWLETDALSKAKIAIGLIGEVEVGGNSRVGLLEAAAGAQRMSLKQGSIFARIWAPPRVFSVATPSATAVDLGCVYRLDVDDSGAGVVRVATGWVAFEDRGRESFIPAGAMCATRPGIGPGTPYYEDVRPAFAASLERLDFAGDVAALDVVLREARARDAFTLWHLLRRVPPSDRGRVFDRLAALVPPPAQVTREGILRGNPQLLDLWWNALGLDSASWWRVWKKPFPG